MKNVPKKRFTITRRLSKIKPQPTRVVETDIKLPPEIWGKVLEKVPQHEARRTRMRLASVAPALGDFMTVEDRMVGQFLQKHKSADAFVFVDRVKKGDIVASYIMSIKLTKNGDGVKSFSYLPVSKDTLADLAFRKNAYYQRLKFTINFGLESAFVKVRLTAAEYFGAAGIIFRLPVWYKVAPRLSKQRDFAARIARIAIKHLEQVLKQ